MERPRRRAVEVGADQRLDAALHLAGGTVREGEEQKRRGVDTVLDETRDAIDERAGLARARARDDERRPVASKHDRLLLLVQLPRVVDAVALRGRGAPEDVLPQGGGVVAHAAGEITPARRTACSRARAPARRTGTRTPRRSRSPAS